MNAESTVYLCGLNDRLGNEYKKEDTHVLLSIKFPPLTRKHHRVFRGTIHKNKNSFSPDELLFKLKHYLSYNLSDIPDFCRVYLLAMNKYNFENTAVLLQDNLDDDRNSIYFQWYSLALDIIQINDI